ncbi:MAG: hypothetical protein RIE53_09525 [Rhodothermales bacterium]
MRSYFSALCFALLMLLLALPGTTRAQSVGITVNDVGVSIGDSEELTGLRLNYRDRNLRRVNGMNVTIWSPYEPWTGDVSGIAVGLPLTGARNITGIGWGLFGVGAEQDMEGIAWGGLGIGAGRDLSGVMLGGLGVGTGRDIAGIAMGGLGVGAGEDMTGIALAGIGAGVGGDMFGIMMAGIGLGAGGDMTGISLSGFASGAGGTMKGIHMASFALGATALEGLFVTGFAAGASDFTGLAVAPGYFRIDDGTHHGLSVSAVSDIRGTQQGVTIGLFNYARNLSGVQIGILNYARNKNRFKVMPLINF